MDRHHLFQKVQKQKSCHKICVTSVSYKSHGSNGQFANQSRPLIVMRQAYLLVTYLLCFLFNGFYKRFQLMIQGLKTQ
jgi:hypothetical protein